MCIFRLSVDNFSLQLCVSGMRLELMQSKLGVVQILKDYEVSPCDKTKISVILDPKTIITTALGGVQLNIRKITAAAD